MTCKVMPITQKMTWWKAESGCALPSDCLAYA